jgi:hypothetical protein
VFLIQSFKLTIDVVVETMGQPNLKNIFKALFHIQYWQILTALNTRFLSFNLEARNYALFLTNKGIELDLLFPAD